MEFIVSIMCYVFKYFEQTQKKGKFWGETVQRSFRKLQQRVSTRYEHFKDRGFTYNFNQDLRSTDDTQMVPFP